MSLGGLYDYISISLGILSGIILTLSIYFLYLRVKEETGERSIS